MSERSRVEIYLDMESAEDRLAEAWRAICDGPPEAMPSGDLFVRLAWILARQDLRPKIGETPT